MLEYRLNKRALVDLDKIAEYSYENFGLQRGDAYSESLFAAFRGLVEFPEKGTSINHIKRNTRRLMYESHVIYYRVSKNRITIMRILHQNQDPLRHL